MAEWDHVTDVVIVGTGAAGLGAALTACDHGLDVLILEKGQMVGGSTALAGGGIWIPNNRFMREAGIADSAEDAYRYLDRVVGDQGPATSPARRRAFVESAPAAIAFYEQAGMRFRRTSGYPDYHPDEPGASKFGRGIESQIFDMRKIEQYSDRLVRRGFPRNMPMGTLDVANLVLARRTLKGALTYARIFAHFIWGKATRRKLAGGGAALVGQLLYQTMRRKISIWVESPAMELIEDDQRVVGVVVKKEGRTLRIRARRAVHLGGGGFARNAEMRKRYQPAPVTGAWTSASPSDTGNAITLGMTLGADTALMDEAWWGPASVLPTGQGMFHVSERSKPGSLIVDQNGVRYMNEAQSYVDAVHAMFRHQAEGAGGIPSWLVFDQQYRSRYPFGMLLPGVTPQHLVDAGYFRRAHSIEELAVMCDINPTTLRATIERFNGMAKMGIDSDYSRGANVYDRYFGDPRIKPNPCLAPLVKPPFYGVALYPGDLGTKGGLVTDEHGRVLRPGGPVITGLYASGNTTASPMGRRYPGPGCTLGPALTFSYLAMKHAAGSAGKIRQI
jgi:succinate dehydrogenase/fumarate reductase flavoprotein subunit